MKNTKATQMRGKAEVHSYCQLGQRETITNKDAMFSFMNNTFSVLFIKLDGVGPVDNRPSIDKLHHFVQNKKKL